MHVDLDLIRKYNERLPRYTSYPTAPYFTEEMGASVFQEEVQRSNADANAGPLSLYLHLPFCRQLCYYCGCHMKVTHNPERIERYLGYLYREIDRTAQQLDRSRPVVQIHWGGGTPTYLSPEQIEALGTRLEERFDITDDAEISIEADPRGLTEEHIDAARRVGFNRISIGVQDFDPEVQEAINRVQPEPLVRDAVGWARDYGYESINLDLVYGLPHQTLPQFSETIDKVIDIGPDRIALFSYAHVPSVMQHQELIPEEALPDPSEKLDILKMSIETLTDVGGYRFIGMDHFARPDDPLSIAQDEGSLYRNFQGYSTHSEADVYAFGPSGIHQLQSMYAQNVKGLRDYYDRIDDDEPLVYRGYRLSPEDHLRREVITELMCNLKLDKRAIEARYGISFDATFAPALDRLRPLEADGLVTLDEDRITVRSAGRLLIRNIASAFDAYLHEQTEDDQPVYSQSV